MRLVIGERQSGRTTDLIKAAAEDKTTGVKYIVCHSHEEAVRIARLAEKMGLHIGFPLTYDEFLHRSSYYRTNIDKFYIDNLRMLLAHISNVEIDTVVW